MMLHIIVENSYLHFLRTYLINMKLGFYLKNKNIKTQSKSGINKLIQWLHGAFKEQVSIILNLWLLF